MSFLSKTISLILFILLSPIFIITSIFCIIFQGNPVFFKQKRIGYNYKIFSIYKFRSMKKCTGPIITFANDERVTIFGKILRKTKIDEIPQLVNVIKGDMRFIGPRPEVLEYFDKARFSFLKKVKPGMSDFASILLRNEEEILKKISGDDPYDEVLIFKLLLANYYSNNKSFYLDLKLVFMTLLSIFFPGLAAKSFVIPTILKDVPESKFFY